MGAVMEWIAFGLLAFIALAGALGMATTMSMFRSGIFLMASFIGVAGLFVLLSADLLGLLQVMMYIGGMLVMILFMVLFSHDPGGSMMAGMEGLSPVERAFSLGLSPEGEESDQPGDDGPETHGAGHEMSAGGHEGHDGMEGMTAGSHEGHDGMAGTAAGGHEGHDGMSMADMSMTTPVKRWAALLGGVLGAGLMLLILLRPAWPVAAQVPDPDSARRVGELLMGKYMMAFEGAGLLILIGIFGAVLLARPGSYPDPVSRAVPVTSDAPLPPIDEDRPPSADAFVPAAEGVETEVLASHGDRPGEDER